MRISDWSSDVCSSDLLAPSSGASRHLLPLRRRRAVWPALIRRFVPPFSRFAGEGLSGRPPSGALRHLLPLRRRRAVWPALIRRFAHLRSPKAATRSARSEEHTYELQSLMRISYAVLCLKKKNKQT